MPTSEPLHIAFVWHMHQPYYRSSRAAPFDMPWARMHALKDYVDMIDILSEYPNIHQTFNLVPSLVEQLETYAAGGFADTYWEHTLKPAQDLEPAERAFIVERMCEHSDHPRARSHPRYLELALKRDALASQGWDACAAAFTVDELRDLQLWFNLAWFDPQSLESLPLSDLVDRGYHFAEEDKASLALVQQDLLTRTLPAYKDAAARGQIEISTSPYFHPILPLLINTDSARVAAADVLLPRKRFAHPEDALEQVRRGIAKHEAVFGVKPLGIWCSEQAVGEDVIPLLLRSGFEWTISDETILARSFSGVGDFGVPGRSAAPVGDGSPEPLAPLDLYTPYRLERGGGALSIVFRDHTLSDLIGFAYSSWNSRDAAADLIRRLREIRAAIVPAAAPTASQGPLRGGVPLVTIALDGENAWEYYPRDGRDFLQYLYEGLSADPDLRCVTVSEHLRESPPTRSLDWLHTGSWIGGDLRTWIGDPAHGTAWELLQEARSAVSRTAAETESGSAGPHTVEPDVEKAWQHILTAEGSDWFWWFGEHHHTQLDAVWDSSFRRHLEEAYRLLGQHIPLELFFPIITGGSGQQPLPPKGPVSPVIDGVVGPGADDSNGEWDAAGFLARALSSTMQRAEGTGIREVRFGWSGRNLCLLIVPDSPQALRGLEIQVELVRPSSGEGLLFLAGLEDGASVRTECKLCPQAALDMAGAWKDVVELSLPVPWIDSSAAAAETGLVVRTGRDGMTEHIFHSTRLGSQGWVTK
jgi:alpha-amylase/alpha-mannosidase (GH57 family)